MENEIIIGLIGLGTTITSGWVSWFFARKKYNSEVDNQVIINMQKALEFYQHLSDDNTDRLAKVLAQNPYVKLAVFFDFEESVYREAGCNVVRVKHPFAEIKNADCCGENFHNENYDGAAKQILLLPGSRKSQALRNLPIYLKAVQNAKNVVVVAARQELVGAFKKFNVPVIVAPQSAAERMALYQSAEYALTAPGTSTLELALSGASFAVCTKPDMLTYGLGRLFIKTKFFALPNIILDRLVFSEYIVPPWSGEKIWSFAKGERENVAKELSEKLAVGQTLESLALEFLGQFV